jgi:ketosteroid isomerase-like protein
MRQISVLTLALLVTACAPKTDASGNAASATALTGAQLDSVKGVDVAWAAAMNAKDTAAVLAVYADDSKLLPPDSRILDKAGTRTVFAGLLAGGGTDFVLTPVAAYGVGDLGYNVGTATFKMGGASETVKYMDVVRRGADGKWRYVADMFSGVAPAAPAASVKPK